MTSRGESIIGAVRECGGVISGADLAQKLCDIEDVSPENARQIIKRAVGKGTISRYDLGQDSLYALTDNPIGPGTNVSHLLAALDSAHQGLGSVCRVLRSIQSMSIGEALKISDNRGRSPFIS